MKYCLRSNQYEGNMIDSLGDRTVTNAALRLSKGYVRISGRVLAIPGPPRSCEYKEDLSSAAKRTGEYGERATEESDAVIAESSDGATGFAGWQVDTAREV
jgi:hypothetical protein